MFFSSSNFLDDQNKCYKGALTSNCDNSFDCDQSKVNKATFSLVAWYFLKQNSAEQIQLALEFSPVSVIMYACDPFVLKNLGKGIYKNSTACTDTEFTHAVTVIGFGVTENQEQFWKVRNSYSD